MNYYRIADPSDVRDLGDQMAAWRAAGNPKADAWAEQPEQPTPDAVWTNGAWVTPTTDMVSLREERNQRLASCDWTQLPDSPMDRAAWAAYRQALRDLPSVYGGEGPIPWPVAP